MNLSANIVNSRFEQYLNSFEIPNEVFNLYYKIRFISKLVAAIEAGFGFEDEVFYIVKAIMFPFQDF